MKKKIEEETVSPVKEVTHYRVFSDRSALVAQVTSEDEARELAEQFKGNYIKI